METHLLSSPAVILCSDAKSRGKSGLGNFASIYSRTFWAALPEADSNLPSYQDWYTGLP